MITTRLVITVAQEEGSEGREIAKQLASSLRLNYIDEAVLELATENFTQSEVENYIRELARKGRVIFVNCGANFVLHDFEGLINVLIRAPHAVRIERIIQAHQLDWITAAHRLYQASERYASYIRRHYGRDWVNSELYDFVISTQKIPAVSLARGLVRLIQALDQTRATDVNEVIPLPASITEQEQNYHQFAATS